MEGLRVVVLEQRRLVAESLVACLEDSSLVERAWAVADTAAAVKALRWNAQVLVTDDGSAAAVLRFAPQARVLALVRNLDATATCRALRRGAMGVLAGTESTVDLVEAVRHVASGKNRLPAELVGPVVLMLAGQSTEAPHELPDVLTPREREVLQLLGLGYSRRDIARRLTVSQHTTRTHIQNILSKLSLHSQLEAAAYARRAMAEGALPSDLPDGRSGAGSL